jgi:hypothetical protein
MHGISDKQSAFFVAGSHSLTWTRSPSLNLSLSQQPQHIVGNIQYSTGGYAALKFYFDVVE